MAIVCVCGGGGVVYGGEVMQLLTLRAPLSGTFLQEGCRKPVLGVWQLLCEVTGAQYFHVALQLERFLEKLEKVISPPPPPPRGVGACVGGGWGDILVSVWWIADGRLLVLSQVVGNVLQTQNRCFTIYLL